MTTYTTSQAGLMNTFAHFRAWAGDQTGVAYALSQLGFTKQSDAFTAQWANGASAGAAALPIAGGALPNTTTFGAANSGINTNSRSALANNVRWGAYNGATTYQAGDVVTSSAVGSVALTFVYINASPASGQTCDNTTYWSPYWMEIWATNSGTLTNFYFKIEYGCMATISIPQMTIQFGTTYSANSGVIGGNVSVVEYLLYGTSAAPASSPMVFTGDGANYFGMLLWTTVNYGEVIFGFERSISGTVSSLPVYNSSYITYLKNYYGATNPYQQSVFLSGSPATSLRRQYGACVGLTDTTTQVVNGNTPVYPVFPTIGWIGNPLTLFVGVASVDATEAASITTTIYGATHTYYITKATYALYTFAAAGPLAVGMRYE